MKLTFVGAAHEVTGSCHFLQAAGKNILIDCGMEQGPDLYENPGLPIPENEIDYVFLTHAHIDHSGMLPKLAKNGFKGQIFTTFATADLCNIMLRDSAHIQEFEAEWRNRKGRRAGKPEFEPVYVMQDALDAIELLVPCGYGERITICDGIQIRFTDVGHLLGSASIEVWATEGDVTKKIVFSGDIGNVDQPIIKDRLIYISDIPRKDDLLRHITFCCPDFDTGRSKQMCLPTSVKRCLHPVADRDPFPIPARHEQFNRIQRILPHIHGLEFPFSCPSAFPVSPFCLKLLNMSAVTKHDIT